MRKYILLALLGAAWAFDEGEIGKTKGKGEAVAAPPMAAMPVPSGAISMSVNKDSNGKGNIQTVNSMAAAMSALPAALKNDALVAQNPAPQVMSTVSINLGNGNAAAAATPGAPAAGTQPSVVPGTGTTGSGEACSCECLCGSGSFPPNAGIGAFGGFLGTMPGVMASMSPAGTSIPAAAGMAGMAKRW